MAGAGGRARTGIRIKPDLLRQARLDRGLTLAQLASGIVTKQALQGWETGRARPTRQHLQVIAARLGIQVQSLLVDRRDPREDEMARLEQQQQFSRLETLADEVLQDRNVSARTQAVARFYLGRAILKPQPEEAARELHKARTQLVRVGLTALAAEAEDWAAMALYYMQDPAAVDAAARALVRYRRLPGRTPAVEARILEHLGTCQLQLGDNTAAIGSYRTAIETAGSLLDLGRLAIIYHGLATAYGRIGRGREGLDYMERSVVLHRCRDDVTGVVSSDRARAENTYGYQLMRSGDPGRAEGMIRAALDHFAEAGVESGKAEAFLSMGELRQLEGRLDEAMDWTCEAIDLAERLGAVVATAEAYQQLGELFLLQDQPSRCEAAFMRAFELLDEVAMPERRSQAIARFERLLAPPAAATSATPS